MEQMGYETGLIRYTTEAALVEGGALRFFRGRLLGYGLAVLIMFSLFSIALINRVPLRLDVVRDRDRLYVETSNGLIENTYTLNIINMDQSSHQYTITVDGLNEAVIVGNSTAFVDTGEVISLPLRLRLDPVHLTSTNNVIRFTVKANDDDELIYVTESRFIGPRI